MAAVAFPHTTSVTLRPFDPLPPQARARSSTPPPLHLITLRGCCACRPNAAIRQCLVRLMSEHLTCNIYRKRSAMTLDQRWRGDLNLQREADPRSKFSAAECELNIKKRRLRSIREFSYGDTCQSSCNNTFGGSPSDCHI